jgi:apolipoprotein N-acyltransferase
MSAYAAILLLIFVVSAWWPMPERAENVDAQVAAVETQFVNQSRDTLTQRKQVLIDAVTAAIADGKSYVILPEGANFAQFFADDSALLTYLGELSAGDVVVIDSGWVADTSERSFFRARIYDTKTKEVYVLDKQYLVPQGEFMSAFMDLLMRSFGLKTEADALQQFYKGVPGPKSWQSEWPTHIPGVLFCFESIDPFGVRRAAHSGQTPFVAHIVSHGWFHEPYVLWHQLDQMLRVNTRFAQIPLFQAANMYEAKRY